MSTMILQVLHYMTLHV